MVPVKKRGLVCSMHAAMRMQSWEHSLARALVSCLARTLAGTFVYTLRTRAPPDPPMYAGGLRPPTPPLNVGMWPPHLLAIQ